MNIGMQGDFMITVNEAIARILKQINTEIVFGLPNDDLLLMKEIKTQGIQFLDTKDQRNAVFMATGYALSSNKLGVCVVGKGPALTNCITGMLEAKSQSVPLLLIATATSTKTYGSNKTFQEANQLDIVKPLAKWAHRVESVDSFQWVMNKAIFLARNSTEGIIYVEIPEDLGTKLISEKDVGINQKEKLVFLACDTSFEKAVKEIEVAKKPVLILGGGIKGKVDIECIEAFAEKLNLAVFVTASGRGCFNEESPLYCGLIGLYCFEEMQKIIQISDVVMVIGSKLEETALFGIHSYLLTKNVIQINTDAEGFNLSFSGSNLLSDGVAIINKFNTSLEKQLNNSDWRHFIETQKQTLFDNTIQKKYCSEKLRVRHILQKLNQHCPEKTIFVHENGLQDMWSYFYPFHRLKKGQLTYVPSEQTSLGFGVAAATGIAKAHPDRPLVVIAGDGAFNMFQSDLQTQLVQETPVIYIILNNERYGWLEYQNNYQDVIGEFKNIVTYNVEQLANVDVVKTTEEIEPAILRALDELNNDKTSILNFKVELTDIPNPLKTIYGSFPNEEELISIEKH